MKTGLAEGMVSIMVYSAGAWRSTNGGPPLPGVHKRQNCRTLFRQLLGGGRDDRIVTTYHIIWLALLLIRGVATIVGSIVFVRS